MRIRMMVAAVEMQSDDVVLVKLHPVNEQPEPELFPKDAAPQASFALQVAAGQIDNFPVGKKFDMLFALPIHQVPVEEKRQRHVEIQEAVEEFRALSPDTESVH